jgi:hypothetical protein
MKHYFARGQRIWVSALVLGVALMVVPSAMAGAQYQATILGDGPIGYWRLGESQTAGIATDISGSGRNGVYTRTVVSGVPGAIAGDPDTAATFDGLTTGVNVPALGTDGFNFTNSFSLEAWVINQGQGSLNSASSPLGRIVSRGWPGMFGYGWGILASNGMRFTTFGVKDFDSSQTVVPMDGAWHYVVVVFDSTNTANFFLDGVQTDAISDVNPVRTTALDLWIGRNPASTAEEFFNGNIDEVAIYNFELSSDQIAAHYKAGQ